MATLSFYMRDKQNGNCIHIPVRRQAVKKENVTQADKKAILGPPLGGMRGARVLA